jgi:hypothetical protein
MRRVAQENQEVTEEQKVIAGITNTPRGIPIREHTTTQVHSLLGSIIGPGWMSYEEK